MSAYVLFNLLNELEKRDLAFYLFFCSEFNKLDNTRARMLYSIYYMTLNLL